MLLPDDLIIKNNCSKEMINFHKKYKSSLIASMKVKKNNVSRWGIYLKIKKLIKEILLLKMLLKNLALKMRLLICCYW